jgi:hypothetical protein
MGNSQPKGVRYGGRQRGTKNKATILREQMVAHASQTHDFQQGFDIKIATDLERLEWAGLQFVEWFESEKAKGANADLDRMIELLREARDTFAKSAPYKHPKLQVHRMSEPPRSDEPVLVTLRAEGQPDRTYLNGELIDERSKTSPRGWLRD